jgi:PII-like signaling protein
MIKKQKKESSMKRYLGKKKVLKIYIDTMDKYEKKPLYEALLEEVKKEKLAGATVYKGVAGIGAFTEVHSFKVWALAQELPLVVEVIDDEDKILNFIDHIDGMLDNGLITLTDTEVIKYKHENFNKDPQ